MSFDDLGLSPELLGSVANEGYTEPTPVQREAIPLVLAGRDLLAGAQTGTGKTAAFVLPMLQLLHARPVTGHRAVRALIVTPTRELALQVEGSVRTYGAQRPIRSTTIYGGVGFELQVRALGGGPEIVVATPGRLLDHLGQRTIDLSRVEMLVLDEADRMLDMGFIRDIRKILAALPPRRQNLLFSATFSDEIRELANGLLDRPASVQVAPRNKATDLVTQVVHPVDRERKRELLSHLIRSGRIDQALVFTRTKHGANRLATQLEHDGILATAIHGNKSQPQRVRALADFKAGRFTVLVATEVVARGIDIDALPHVVNFELPMVPEDYVHRIGRTGRAGVDGDAVSLVCVDELKLLRDIERVLGHVIPTETIKGFGPDLRIRPEPILRGGLGGVRPIHAQHASSARPHMGASRSPGAPRGAGQPRRMGTPPTAGAPQPMHGQRPNRPQPATWRAHVASHGPTARQPNHTPRPANDLAWTEPPRPAPNRDGQAFRGPGQGIGNRPSGRPPQRSRQGGRPRPGSGPMPGRTLPGERLARSSGRSSD